MSVPSNKYTLKAPGDSNTLFIKFHVLVIFLSFFFTHVAFGQREKIDSLKKVLPSLHDSARIDCLNGLSGAYLNYNRDTAQHSGPGNSSGDR